MKKITSILFVIAAMLSCACSGNDYPATVLNTEILSIDTDGESACLNVKVTVEYSGMGAEQSGCLVYIDNGIETDPEDFPAFVNAVESTCYGAVDLESADESVTREYEVAIPLSGEALEGADLNHLQICAVVFDADNMLFASETTVAEANIEDVPINDLSPASGGDETFGSSFADNFKREFMKNLVSGAIEGLLGGGSSGGGLFDTGSDRRGYYGDGDTDAEPCPFCNGNGRCPECNDNAAEKDDCSHCGGNGICPSCMGRGTK